MNASSVDVMWRPSRCEGVPEGWLKAKRVGGAVDLPAIPVPGNDDLAPGRHRAFDAEHREQNETHLRPLRRSVNLPPYVRPCASLMVGSDPSGVGKVHSRPAAGAECQTKETELGRCGVGAFPDQVRLGSGAPSGHLHQFDAVSDRAERTN